MSAFSFLKTLLSQLWSKASEHKILAVFLIAVVLGGGYYAYTKLNSASTETRYVLAAVQKGTLVASVSGSGQVSASNQMDIKSKVSGDVIYIGAKNGEEIKSGALVVQLDIKDAEKAVRDARVALDQAKLNLEKMKGLNTLAGDIRGVKEKAADNLNKAYEDGFNTVSNAFLDLPDIMSGLQNLLLGYTLSGSGQQNIDYYYDAVEPYDVSVYKFRQDALDKYNAARSSYDRNFIGYKAASRFSSTDAIEGLISQTYEATKLISESVKTSNNLIQLYKDTLTKQNKKPNSLTDSALSQLSAYTGKVNSYLASFLSIRDTIQSNKEALIETDFDISDQQIKVTQAQDALSDAEDKLAECYVRAPLSGVITKISVKKGDSVSGSTAIATIVSKQRIAEISLNEVDVAKVKVGEKATLTFDAVPDLSITGEVAEMDTIGAVSQGVVSYTVKISFDTQDDRVKPGMSVSAAIITDTKQDVLLTPNSAVKSEGNMQYVEVMVNNIPQRRAVGTGLINDTMTEIVNGLQEGEQVVTQTITANTNTNTATQTKTQNTGLRIPGLGGGR